MSEVKLSEFRLKSTEELQEILEKPYYYDAHSVEAAQQVLMERERKRETESITPPPPVIATLPDQPTSNVPLPKKKKYKEPKNPLYFIKKYRVSDFLTLIALAITWAAYLALLDYYRGEPIFEDAPYTYAFFLILTFFIFPLFGHAFYRYEHGHSNNYLGRVLASFSLIGGFALFSKLYYALVEDNSNHVVQNGEDILGVFFVTFIFALAYEAGVILFRKLLRALKWDVL